MKHSKPDNPWRDKFNQPDRAKPKAHHSLRETQGGSQRHSPVAFWDRLEARHKGMEYDWWDPTHISVLPRHRLEALLTGAGFDILNRCGVCFAPDAFAVRSRTCRRLRHASTTGMMARYGWNLIYTCRAV